MEYRDYIMQHMEDAYKVVNKYEMYEITTEEELMEATNVYTAYFLAVYIGDLDYCKDIVASGEIDCIGDINGHDVDMMLFVNDKNIHVFKWAVEAGGIDTRTTKDQRSYCEQQMHYGNWECAKWLAKKYDTPITDRECADWMGKRYNSAIHHM